MNRQGPAAEVREARLGSHQWCPPMQHAHWGVLPHFKVADAVEQRHVRWQERTCSPTHSAVVFAFGGLPFFHGRQHLACRDLHVKGANTDTSGLQTLATCLYRSTAHHVATWFVGVCLPAWREIREVHKDGGRARQNTGKERRRTAME